MEKSLNLSYNVFKTISVYFSNEALTDNFTLNYIGHQSAEFSKRQYGSHKNLRGGKEYEAKIDQALKNAIPLTGNELDAAI